MKHTIRVSLQQGVSLVVGLVVLLFLTLIAVTAVRMQTLDEKIVYNATDNERALLSADAARIDAENFISGATDVSSFTNANGLYSFGNAPNPFTSTTWSGTAAVTANSVAGAQTPQYFIEYTGQSSSDPSSKNTAVTMTNYGESTGAVEPSYNFRIVARGTGGSGNSESVTESFYAKTL